MKSSQPPDPKRDEFLATLAHELRNPLAPLRNALYLLQRQEHNADLRSIHAIMDRQLRHLVRIVDDLLDLSRVTRGKISLQRRVVDIASVVEAAVEASQPLLEAGRHSFAVTMPQAPLCVHADPGRLAQALANLLDNAAKFTNPGGRIWLTAEASGGEVVITVADSGIGIPTHLLDAVFEMFRQVEEPEHVRGGLGIGLTLARQLVEMHAGRVEAYSDGIGRGSRFVVKLPMVSAADPAERPASSGSAGPAPASGTPHQRILVVDDNVDSAYSLALLLRELGHDVRVAHDGQSGLSAALRYRPSLVFLDIALPKLSGHAVARCLRARFGSQQMRLVAMTGFGNADDRMRSSSAGFDQHLVKPVEWSAIQATLEA